MNFITWAVHQVFDNDPKFAFPLSIAGIIISALMCMISIYLGIIIFGISIIFAGLVGYVYLSEKFKKYYKEYQESQNKE